MIDVAPLLGLGLLLVRPGTLILAGPGFGGPYAPATVKIGLTLLLAFALAPVARVPHVSSALVLTGYVFREFAVGLSLAMAIRALVAAAELGGQLAGFQMGLSYGAIVDPQSGVRNNLLAALYANIAVVTFLATNAHHAFLRALRDSYQRLPIGGGSIGDGLPQGVIELMAVVFTFGVRLAAPLVIVLVITEIALALIARSAPALNLMAVGGPARIIVGLILLGLVTPAVVGVLGGLSSHLVQTGVRLTEVFR